MPYGNHWNITNSIAIDYTRNVYKDIVMSLVKNHSGTTEAIVEYIRNHPDFFVQHPELIPDLVIPHTTEENVVSLIEYQISRLRRQFTDLQRNVKAMESGTSNIHALSLDLLASASPEKLYICLQSGLKTYYSANRVLLLLFPKSVAPDNCSGIHFMDPSSKLRFMFAGLFHRNKPLCGSLQEEHLFELFDGDTDLIKSTVLLPMDHACWQGLLVLGSREPDRYSHGFEIDLLVYLKDIVYFRICNFIATSNTPVQ